MAKTYKPLEAIGVIVGAIRETLKKHLQDDQTISSPKTEENATATGLTKPTELIHETYLTGQEPSHADALDHHASLAVAHFHAGNESLAKTHRELAIAHGNKVGLDALAFMQAVYGQFEGISIPVGEVFLPHGMDTKLEKRQEPVEAVDIPTGAGVDRVHTGETPDDVKPELLNDPQEDDVKPAKKKEGEDSEETTDQSLDKVSDEAQDYISQKISRLRHEGYPQEQAIAIAHSYARKQGYSVPTQKSESWENVERANKALFAHQLGLFEPIEKALQPTPPPPPTTAASGVAGAPLGGVMGNRLGIRKEEDKEEDEEESTTNDESVSDVVDTVEKAFPGSPFDPKTKSGARRAKIAPAYVKDELSPDQELDGKGKPENNEDRCNAVLRKEKK